MHGMGMLTDRRHVPLHMRTLNEYNMPVTLTNVILTTRETYITLDLTKPYKLNTGIRSLGKSRLGCDFQLSLGVQFVSRTQLNACPALPMKPPRMKPSSARWIGSTSLRTPQL